MAQEHERDNDEEMDAVVEGHVRCETAIGRVPTVLRVVESERQLIEPCSL